MGRWSNFIFSCIVRHNLYGGRRFIFFFSMLLFVYRFFSFLFVFGLSVFSYCSSADITSLVSDAYIADEVIVVLKDLPVTQQGISLFQTSDPLLANATLINSDQKLLVVPVVQGNTVASTVVALQDNPLVAYVQPNYIYHSFSFPYPQDTYFAAQW